MPAMCGTEWGYKAGCRCDSCRGAATVAQRVRRERKRLGIEPPRRIETASRPNCVTCGRRIVGIPAGWKHVADNRQFGDDGHEAAPRVAA